MLKIVILTLLVAGMAGCSLAPRVESDALAYHETADVVANQIILLNILRAKDDAPLHFGEFSLVHGSISEAGTALLTEPIGQVPKSSSLPRASLAPSASVGDQVTFDLGTLDTQTFFQGITAPISPKMLKYFLDSGVDHRLVLLLLLSSARLPGGDEAIANYPRSERYVCYPDGPLNPGEFPTRYRLRGMDVAAQDCPGREREFVAFLRILNGLPRVYAMAHRRATPVGPPFRADGTHMLHDLLGMDPEKYALKPLPGGMVQLTAQSAEDKVFLCRDRSMAVANQASDRTKGVLDDPCLPDTRLATESPSNQPLSDFTVRSTLGIFSFLGQVLGSEVRRSEHAGTEICITLEDRGAQHDCASGQVLFHLTHVPASSRFGVIYRGEYWGVPITEPCLDSTRTCDHTLETLSMVSLLLNLSKSARDIPSTPAVQLVP